MSEISLVMGMIRPWTHFKTYLSFFEEVFDLNVEDGSQLFPRAPSVSLELEEHFQAIQFSTKVAICSTIMIWLEE